MGHTLHYEIWRILYIWKGSFKKCRVIYNLFRTFEINFIHHHHHHQSALFCPLLNIGLLQMSPVFFRFFAVFTQFVDILFISSVHRVGGLPQLRLSTLGLHSRSFFVHLPFSIIAICPAHLHFCFAMRSMMSSTPVRLRISSFLTQALLCTV